MKTFTIKPMWEDTTKDGTKIFRCDGKVWLPHPTDPRPSAQRLVGKEEQVGEQTTLHDIK